MAKPHGFGLLSEEQKKAIASLGGKAAHAKPKRRGKPRVHEFTPREARKAGRKGGKTTGQDRAHMAEIGRKGGATMKARWKQQREERNRRMKIMTLKIGKGGKTAQLSITGACGPECQEMARPIEEGLGLVIGEHPTEEMYLPQQVVSQEQ